MGNVPLESIGRYPSLAHLGTCPPLISLRPFRTTPELLPHGDQALCDDGVQASQ